MQDEIARVVDHFQALSQRRKVGVPRAGRDGAATQAAVLDVDTANALAIGGELFARLAEVLDELGVIRRGTEGRRIRNAEARPPS